MAEVNDKPANTERSRRCSIFLQFSFTITGIMCRLYELLAERKRKPESEQCAYILPHS